MFFFSCRVIFISSWSSWLHKLLFYHIFIFFPLVDEVVFWQARILAHYISDSPGVDMTFFLSHVLELIEEVVVWDERRENIACLKRIEVAKENVDSALLNT